MRVVSTNIKWPFYMAIADLWNAPLRAVLDAVGIGSLIALVIILAGLKNGVVVGFASDQLNTPESQRVFVVPRMPITHEDIDWLASLPETGFVKPSSSFSNSRIEIYHSEMNDTLKQRGVNVLLVPSGENDPYLSLKKVKPEGLNVVIGNDTAESLSVKVGETVRIELQETGYSNKIDINLQVIGVVESSQWFNRAIFLDSDLVIAIESRSYDKAVVLDQSKPRFGVGSRNSFPGVRLYAKSPELVGSLVLKANARGWDAQSREALIEERQALEKIVKTVFWIILAITSVTFIVIVVTGLISRSLRLARPITMVRIHGMSRLVTPMVTFVQVLAIVITGWILGSGISIVVADILNRELPELLETLNVTGDPCIINLNLLLNVGFFSVMFSLVASMFFFLNFSKKNSLVVRWND